MIGPSTEMTDAARDSGVAPAPLPPAVPAARRSETRRCRARAAARPRAVPARAVPAHAARRAPGGGPRAARAASRMA
jgi:hypothetical protein